MAFGRRANAARRTGESGPAYRGERFMNAARVLLLFPALAAAALQLISVEIDFTHANSPTTRKYLPETMGGGVALLDYDNDGRLDIFFVNGAKIADPMSPGRLPDKTDRKFWNRLY